MHRNEESSSKKSHKRKREDELESISDVIEVEEEIKEKKPKLKKPRKKGEKDVSGATIQQPALDAFQPQQPIVAREFNGHDVDKLSVNEHFRYMYNSNKVGHAVVVKDTDGKNLALQFHIPAGEQKDTPAFRPLEDIEEFETFGMTRFRAHTPDGTKMFATRFEDGEFDGEQLRIWNFSPAPKGKKEPFWGSDKELPLFDSEALEDEEVKAELAEIQKKGTQFKGGRELVIHPPSVPIRDAITTRKPDQNTVMGESAKDAYEAFLETWEGELSDDMKKVFKKAIEAPLRDMFEGQRRPEWLHAEGFGLTPMSMDPQRKDNLGSAGKWANTEMMILERIVKWFAMNRPEAKEIIKPHFEMLLDSELVKKIHFEVSVEEQGHIMKLRQEINPLKQWPLYRKATDLTQGAAVTYSLLHGIEPVSKDAIKIGGETLRARKKEVKKTEGKDTEIKKTGKLAETKVAEKPVAEEKKTVAEVKVPQIAVPVAAQPPIAKPDYFPTQLRHQDSVLKIYTTSKEANYDEPWNGATQHAWGGSGLVVEHNGKKFVLTNAHVAENAVNMRARFANDRKKKYQAKCVSICYQSDLALLEIQDPEFQQKAVSTVLGDMVSMRQAVEVVGFPMGGEEVNISSGFVSRIEVGDYCESGLDMLQVGVDAAVNPGNSGGPVFSDGKVVGVAFQGWDRQGLGFIIPIPIITHFLTEAFRGNPTPSFPVVPMELEQLVNPLLRKSYGMKPEHTGVRVKKVDDLGDAHTKLKVNDILLEIDGLRILDEGKVDMPGIGNAIDMLHVMHSKFKGDFVKFKVLRKDPVTNQPVILNVKVKLDYAPLETSKVPQKEFDKLATYFVCSGISFEPLTRNYMAERGADLEEYVDFETGRHITDIPKKSPDEQIVVINDVLDCEETEGYEDAINEIVKEVNGKKINNIKDLVLAMDNHRGNEHMIIVGGGKRIVVPNMTKTQHAALLERYEIPADRSKDLRAIALVPDDDAMDIDEPVVARAPVAAVIAPKPVRATTANVLQMFKKKEAHKEKSEEELMPDFDGSEESAEAEKNPRELTINDLPGVKRYRGVIDRIEQHYGQFDQDALDEYDDEFAPDDEEELGSNDSSSAASGSEESSDEKGVKQEPANKPSFFSGKRKRDDEEHEEKSRESKRPRREARR